MAILNIIVQPTVGGTKQASTTGQYFTDKGAFNKDVITFDKSNVDAIETMNRLVYAASVLYSLPAETRDRASILGLTLPRVLTQLCFMLTGSPKKDLGGKVVAGGTIARAMFEACPSLHSRSTTVNTGSIARLKTAGVDGSVRIPSSLFNLGKLNKSTMGEPISDMLSIALAIIGGEVDKDTLETNFYKKSETATASGWFNRVVDPSKGKKLNTVREAHAKFAQALPAFVPNRSTAAGEKAFATWLSSDSGKFAANELRVSVKA